MGVFNSISRKVSRRERLDSLCVVGLIVGARSKPKVFGSLVFQVITTTSFSWKNFSASSGKREEI
jgi:hypothetical protein